MKKFVTSIGMLVIILAGVLLTGCGGNDSTKEISSSRIESIKKSGKLVLATGNYRPFEYRDDKTNKMVGYDIDLAYKIAEKIGVSLEIHDMQFASLIPTLQNDQADLVIGALYINDERKKIVDMSDSYLATGQIIAARKEAEDIKSISDLEGKTVGVKVGSSSEKAVNDLNKNNKITIKSYKTNEEALLDLQQGRLDAVVDDLLYQLEYNKSNPNIKVIGEPFVGADLGVAVKKGDTELLALVNSVLKEMEQSGEKEKLYQKWIKGTEKE